MDLYNAVRILSILGIVVMSYLTYIHYYHQYCLQPDACIIVNSSEYATLAGIPVAVYGLAYFIYAFAQTFVKDRRVELLTILITAVALGYGLYLTYVSVTILNAVCVFCEFAKVIIFAILLAVCIQYFPSLRRFA